MTAGAPGSPMVANAEPAYARSPQAVVSDLGSDIERGLSEAEVAQRQSTYGLNEIAAPRSRRPWWRSHWDSCAIR